MTNENELIRRGDAISELSKHAKGTTTLGGQNYQSMTLEVAIDAIAAIPAIDPAAIREAALKEAVKSLRDWQTHLNRHSYKETAITIGMSADVVEALIGEKK
jgi:uncharacterized pyridoxal phosphate-containing UPF0001 family protein